MQKISIGHIQLGKNGITDNFILTLENMFKNHRNVKISVLKAARGEGKEAREKVREYEGKILEKLGRNYVSRIIGFTITVKKFRKPVR